MTQTLEQLGRQQATLNSIGGIVRTMRTLSAINAVPYEQAATAIENFQQVVEKSFANFAHASGGIHWLQDRPQQALLIAFGSDHGLCGNYNELLAQTVEHHWQRLQVPGQVLCIGSQLADALRDKSIQPQQVLMPPASVEGITRLAGKIVRLIEPLTGNDSLAGLAIDLAYTERAPHGTRHERVVPLLPLPGKLLSRPAVWPGRSLPAFSQDSRSMLSALVRNYIFSRVYRAQAEAMATENAARLALMQQARQSVDERLFELNQQINSRRQDAITDELMDVIIGHL